MLYYNETPTPLPSPAPTLYPQAMGRLSENLGEIDHI